MFDSKKFWNEFYTKAFGGDLAYDEIRDLHQAIAAAAGWLDRLELGGDVVTINEARIIRDNLSDLDCDFG